MLSGGEHNNCYNPCLATSADVILADEPTGNTDNKCINIIIC